MRDAECLVFVEVRYRRPGRYGSAADSIDGRKQRKLTAAAAMFLGINPGYARNPARFDVIAMDGPTQGESNIQWLRDAFRPPA